MNEQRRNEYDVVVDSNNVAHLEILVEHGAGEIWARISLLSRLLESVTLYRGGDEVDIKADILSDWIDFPKFRTLADIRELHEEIETWRPAEPDYEAIIDARNEAMADNGPLA